MSMDEKPSGYECYRDSLVRAFNEAVADYDESTAAHSVRVGNLVGALAAQLNLDQPDRLLATHVGIIHDLGKLGIKPAILAKPGPLTAAERAEVQRHSAIGAEVLLDISPDLTALAEGVRAHHERWDGTGYPDGLVGEQIPLFGRIISVADVYDAMTSPRHYRPSVFTHDETTAYIEDQAGVQFDPECAGAIVEVLRSQGRGRTQFSF